MQKWSKEEEDILRNYYGKITATKISKLYLKRTASAIRYKAQLLRLKGYSRSSKKYHFNESFFENINEENSYWAGYLAADGTISHNRIALQCCILDEIILKEFKKAIDSNHIIYYRSKGKMNVIKNNKNNKEYYGKPSAILRISSRKYVQDLEKNWLITSNKSKTLQPPIHLNLKCSLAYIIGYIDGDGFIGTTSNNAFYFGVISSSKKLLEWIRKIIKNLCPHEQWDDKVWSTHKIFQLKWSLKKGKNIHKMIKNSVQIPYKLSRKWEVDYQNIPKRHKHRTTLEESKIEFYKEKVG
jgi:hypothetical protein